MSKIRYVGGNIIKKTGGNHTIHSLGDMNFSAYRITQSSDTETIFGKPDEYPEGIANRYIEKGWWSSDKEGNNPITEAYLGDVVYFQIQMKETTKDISIYLDFFLKDKGLWGLDWLDPDDKMIVYDGTPNDDINNVKDKRENKKDETKSLYLKPKNNRLTIEFNITEKGAIYDKIKDEGEGKEADLHGLMYARAKVYVSLPNDIISTYVTENLVLPELEKKHLRVSKRPEPDLIFLQPAKNYGFPDIRTNEGDILHMSFNRADGTQKNVTSAIKKLKSQVTGALKGGVKKKFLNYADNHAYNFSIRQLESSKLVDNIGNVHDRSSKKFFELTTYDIDKGEFSKIKRAGDFTMLNSKGQNIKSIGVDQIESFKHIANTSKKGQILNVTKNFISDLSIIADLADNIYKMSQGKPPSVFLPVDMMVEDFINNTWDPFINEAALDALEVYKNNGVYRVESILDQRNIINRETNKFTADTLANLGYGTWKVSMETLNKLLHKEIEYYNFFKKYNNVPNKKGILGVSILYQRVVNPWSKLGFDYYIHTIFIDEEVLGYKKEEDFSVKKWLGF